MRPNPLPPAGTPVNSAQDLVNLVGAIGAQASANSAIEAPGMSADHGASGVVLTPPQPAMLQCFQITSCWTKTNAPPLAGPSLGRFWVCDAVPVEYFYQQGQGTPEATTAETDICGCQTTDATYETPSPGGETDDLYTYYDYSGAQTERLFLPIAALGNEDDWQKALYPSHGIGQWLWCVFDRQADIWRVLAAYDDMVRFQLIDMMDGTGSANAWILGYSDSGSSSGSGAGDEEAGPYECLSGAATRGLALVHDPQGIVNVAFPYERLAPPLTNGWAKWCADSRRFEVVSYGQCECGSSSSSVSSSSASSSSSSSSSGSSASSSSEASSTPSSNPSVPPSSGSRAPSSQGSSAPSSQGSSAPSSQGSSAPSTSEPPSTSETSKSTAIVPASWSPTGYTALFVEESPEVRFDDIMVVEISDKDMLFDIDPRFLEVCHPGSVLVSGCVPDVPCMPGAVVEGGQVRVRTLRVGGFDVVKLTLRLTGIRKGFLGHRFPDRSQRQFEANEKFINSAYPAE